MFCKHCGKEVDPKAELCVHCGLRLRSSVTTFFENSELTQLRPQKATKSTGLAGFLGFMLSWLFLGPFGYLYLGQWNWFWLTVVITVIAYPLTAFTAYFVFPFIFAFHQYQMARELNEIIEPASDGSTPGTPSSPDTGDLGTG